MKKISATPASEHSVKSIEDLDVVWVDECQRLSEQSLELLAPTVREGGSAIWFTGNPRFSRDPVWRMYVVDPPDGAFVCHTHWSINPWWSEEADMERRLFQDRNPQRYAHVYDGTLDDDFDGTLRVLFLSDIDACFDAWEKLGAAKYAVGPVHAGYDVADTGDDSCAVAWRRGPCLLGVETWSGKGSTTGKSTERVLRRCQLEGAEFLWFDPRPAGVVRSDLTRINPSLRWEPVDFGGKVANPEAPFEGGLRQKESFANRSAQMAWELRLRAANTQKLLKGVSDVRPEDALFFHPSLKNDPHFVEQMVRPIYLDDQQRIRIKKDPDGHGSPDRFDSVGLSFSHESRNGVTVGFDPRAVYRERRKKWRSGKLRA